MVELPQQQPTLPVLIKQLQDNHWIATVLGWPGCQAEGHNRESVLERLQESLATHLLNADLIALPLPSLRSLGPSPITTTPHPTPQASDLVSLVLIEQNGPEDWSAKLLNGSECHAQGATRAAALQNLEEQWLLQLAGADIIQLKLPLSRVDHPWMPFAGMLKNDSELEEFIQEMAAERRKDDELDQSVWSTKDRIA